nr:unnamed protein product [Spirometra erinaceieuropaei]
MEGPRPGQAGLEKRWEDWRSHLRNKPDRCRQSQKGCSQVSGASGLQRHHSACSRCRRIFHARIGPVGHFRIQFINRPTTLIVASTTAPASTSTSTTPASSLTNAAPNPRAVLSSAATTSTSFSPITATTSNTTTPTAIVKDQNAPEVPTTTHRFIITTHPPPSDVCLVHTYPHCGLPSTSRIDLVGHFRIHRTETDEPVSGAPTYTRRIHLHCPNCRSTLTHLMGLLGHMRISECGINLDIDIPSTSGTPNIPSS